MQGHELANFQTQSKHSVIDQEPLEPGLLSCVKILKTPFFGEYFKFLPLDNSYGSETTPKIFFENISKTTAARGFQNFGTIEDAALIPTE